MPQIKGFTVGGIFDVGMYEYDSSFVYIPFEDAQAYFNMGDTVRAVEVLVTDPRERRSPAPGPHRGGGPAAAASSIGRT